MAYPVNPTEFRQPPHGSVTQQDDARFVTQGFNFNNFLPVNPIRSGQNFTGVVSIDSSRGGFVDSLQPI